MIWRKADFALPLNSETFDICLQFSKISNSYNIEDIHNSCLYCFANPFKLGTRVSLSHRQMSYDIVNSLGNLPSRQYLQHSCITYAY